MTDFETGFRSEENLLFYGPLGVKIEIGRETGEKDSDNTHYLF